MAFSSFSSIHSACMGGGPAPPNIAGEVFALSFGTSTLPAKDKYGYNLTNSSSSTGSGMMAPSIYNDATRGYVLNVSSAGLATNYIPNVVSFTRACWYYNKTTSPTTTPNLFSTSTTPIWFSNNTNVSVQINAFTGTLITDPTNRGIGSWVHYAFTYNGTSIIIYVNGVSVISGTYSYSTADTTSVNIGYYINGNYNPSAYMDNIHFYNRALSASEVASLYNYENINPKK